MGKKKDVNRRRLKEEEYMVKNGGILMEEIMSISNGRCNPIRTFSGEQLRNATNNFESLLSFRSGMGKWYKTVLEDHPAVLIKTFDDKITAKEACRDIAIASQMSNHGRVLKLLGCCLELPVPALVYEDVEHGRLNVCGGIGPHGSSSLSWKTRLKIAKDIAHALAYLHTAFSRPIIHRFVSPITVCLDKGFVPKLTEFCKSLTIPEGETHVETLTYCGFVGFLAPECYETHSVSERSDVYSFGILLLVLLTGRPAYDYLDPQSENLKEFVREKSWDEIVDPKVLEEGQGMNNEEEKLQLHLQVQAFLHLALRCTQNKEEHRPMMIDVAKQLAQISTRSTTEPKLTN